MEMFDSFKLKNRLTELEDAVSDMRRQMVGIKLEWTDTTVKLNTLLARLSKASQRARELSEQEGGAGAEGATPGNSPEHPRVGALSPRARLIQHQIEERRKQLQKGGTTE